jgi:hypothetical protein
MQLFFLFASNYRNAHSKNSRKKSTDLLGRVSVAVGRDVAATETAEQVKTVSVGGYDGAASPFSQRTHRLPPGMVTHGDGLK